MFHPARAGFKSDFVALPLNFDQDHFALFGLPRRFAMDADLLDRKYRELQREVHPDRFATAGDAEKRLSVQRAAHLNDAYITLKTPLRRARYLLELSGVDAGVETDTAMPRDFLMEQMEWREALAEVDAPAGLDELENRLAGRLEAEYSIMAAQLGQADNGAARDTLRKLMFLEKLREDIAGAYEAMES